MTDCTSVPAYRTHIPVLLLTSTICLLLGGLRSGQANDSYLPESGSPQILSSHETISMEKETIKIQVLEKTVTADCWFVFKNNGPAANVRMGFPDDNGFTAQDADGSGFLYFNSYVNGKWTPTQSAQQNGENWKIKTVAFPANSTVVVRDKYTANIGGVALARDSIGDITGRMAAYTLHTGASWKGNIGRSTVEFTFAFTPYPVAATDSFLRDAASDYRKYFKNGKVVYRGPGKPTVVGKTLRFERTNWKPTEKDDIMMWFLPPPKKAASAAKPKPAKLNARTAAEVAFLKAVPTHATLAQIKKLLPRDTKYSEPKWEQMFGNRITIKGKISGWLWFISPRKKQRDYSDPGHLAEEKYRSSDWINYIQLVMDNGSITSKSNTQTRINDLRKILEKPKTYEYIKAENSDAVGNGYMLPGWTAHWDLKGQRRIECFTRYGFNGKSATILSLSMPNMWAGAG